MRNRLVQFGTVLLGAVAISALCAMAPRTEAAAMEETEETIGEIETFEFLEEDAPYEGTWVSFEAGFKLYIPNEWDQVEADDVQREDGLLFQALSPQEEENVPGISVAVRKNDGESSLADVGERIEEEGYIYNGLVKMNGIPCAAYTSSEDMETDVVGITFFDLSGEDELFEITANHFEDMPSELMTILMSLTAQE